MRAIAACLTGIALVALGIIEILAGYKNKSFAFAVLGPVRLNRACSGGLGLQIEMPIAFDITAVEVGNAFGGAEGNVDEKGFGLDISGLRGARKKVSEDRCNFGVAGKDLFEKCIGAAIGLHHVKDDLIDAVLTQERIDLKQMRQVAIGDDGRCVKLDAKALELRDGIDACHGLLKAFGRSSQTFVQLLCVAVNGYVEAVHPRFGERDGVRHMAEPAAVGHDADPPKTQAFCPADEFWKLWAGRGFARGKAHFFRIPVVFKNPPDALPGHGRVVDVAAVPVFFHAEDAIVVAYRADGYVNAFRLILKPFNDAGLGHRATPVNAIVIEEVPQGQR